MTSTPTPRPTLEQVAAAAGVTKSTASKVLNGRPHVAGATRARVEAAIAALGYVPSTGPRMRRRSVSVVFTTLSDVYATRVLEGVLAAARDQDVEVLVEALDVSEGGTVPLSPPWIRREASSGCTGVIVVTSELSVSQRNLTESLGLPVVHIDPVNPHADLTISVGSTNFAGGMQATSHLLDLGHRRIAYAGGSPSSMPAIERKQGYVSALAARGIVAEDALIRTTAHRFDSGQQMAQEFLAQDVPATAIFAASDSIALGVLAAARQHGLQIPRDLSVVGYDDTYAAVSSAPALTTVRQPIGEMGRVALRTLLSLSNGEAPDSRHVQLSTELVVRESTAPPRVRPLARGDRHPGHA